MSVRQWSDVLFAAYVPEGMFGRFAGTAPTREEAEKLVQEWLDSGWVARNIKPSGGNTSTAGRKDPEGQFGGPR